MDLLKKMDNEKSQHPASLSYIPINKK